MSGWRQNLAGSGGSPVLYLLQEGRAFIYLESCWSPGTVYGNININKYLLNE